MLQLRQRHLLIHHIHHSLLATYNRFLHQLPSPQVSLRIQIIRSLRHHTINRIVNRVLTRHQPMHLIHSLNHQRSMTHNDKNLHRRITIIMVSRRQLGTRHLFKRQVSSHLMLLILNSINLHRLVARSCTNSHDHLRAQANEAYDGDARIKNPNNDQVRVEGNRAIDSDQRRQNLIINKN